MATPDTTSRGISQAISKALRSAGISQREAADRSGIPITTLSRRLTGNSPFLVTELAVLASMVGTPVSELIAAAEADDSASSPQAYHGESARVTGNARSGTKS